VAEAERRDQALDVLAELTDARLVTLATPGTALWLLPDYDRDGFKGFGRVGTSLGGTAMTGSWSSSPRATTSRTTGCGSTRWPC
jgi:hypothetical protein